MALIFGAYIRYYLENQAKKTIRCINHEPFLINRN